MPYNADWKERGRKRCFGPLHPIEGTDLPLSSFHFFKKGPRAGKPLSRCKDCENMYRHGDLDHGFVPVEQVWPIVNELEKRIGKAETCRRAGIGYNFWYRLNNGIYVNVRMATFLALKRLLDVVLETGERRHPGDIHHGTAARGKAEKRLKLKRRRYTRLKDWDYSQFYKPHDKKLFEPETVDSLADWPVEWWHDDETGHMRFGEEMLGKDF